MMGSCALLMPVASTRFIRAGRYDRAMSIGLAIEGVPAVLAAVFLVRFLPLDVLRILVVVVLSTAAGLLRSAFGARAEPDDAA